MMRRKRYKCDNTGRSNDAIGQGGLPVVAMKRCNAREQRGGHSAGKQVNGQRMSLAVLEGAAFNEWHEPCEARVSSGSVSGEGEFPRPLGNPPPAARHQRAKEQHLIEARFMVFLPKCRVGRPIGARVVLFSKASCDLSGQMGSGRRGAETPCPSAPDDRGLHRSLAAARASQGLEICEQSIFLFAVSVTRIVAQCAVAESGFFAAVVTNVVLEFGWSTARPTVSDRRGSTLNTRRACSRASVFGERRTEPSCR